LGPEKNQRQVKGGTKGHSGFGARAPQGVMPTLDRVTKTENQQKGTRGFNDKWAEIAI